jgi:MFS family permease
MDKTFNLIAKALMVVVMAIGVVFTLLILSKGDDAVGDSLLNPYFRITYVIAAFTVGLVVLFAIAGLFQDTKRAIKAIIVLIIMAILVGISFGLASGNIEGDIITSFFEDGKITESGVKWVDAGIMMTYITGGLAVIVTIFAGVSGVFKR